MGAFTNPGALDRRAEIMKQGADTRNALIANIGVQTANIIKSRNQKQLEKLRLDNEAENKRQLILLKQKSTVQRNYTESGLVSDTFYDIGYNNIDNIELYTGKLDTATGKEERQEAAKNLEMAYSNQNNINTFVAKYKGWFDGYSKEMSQSKRNKPNSIYTGGFPPIDPKDKSDWDDFSEKTFENYNLKNALIGSGVDKNGKVLPPAEFYQREDGTIMAKVKGYDDFDVIATIMQEPVMIQDVNKPLRELWEKNKYQDSVTKKFNPKFLDKKNAYINTKINKNGVAITTETYQINPEIQQAWLEETNAYAENYLSSIIDEGSFRNANATLMSIAGTLDTNNDGYIGIDEATFSKAFQNTLSKKQLEKGIKITPLKAINGFYELDNPSKAMFKEVLLSNSYNEFIGPTGTVTEITKIDKNYKAGQGKKGNEMLNNIIEVVNKKPQEQVGYINNNLDPTEQKISYNPKTQIMTETTFETQSTGSKKDGDYKEKVVPEYKTYYLGDDEKMGPKDEEGKNVVGNKKQWENRVFEIFKGTNKQRLEFNKRYQEEDEVEEVDAAALLEKYL